MAWGKNNILSHNVVLSMPHQVVNLLGIYDQSVVSHYYFFKYVQKPLGQYILFKTINKTLIMIFSCHVTR